MNAQTPRHRKQNNYGPFLGYKPEGSGHVPHDECWHNTQCTRISGKELHQLLKYATEDINSRMVKVLFETVVAYLFHSRRLQQHVRQKAA